MKESLHPTTFSLHKMPLYTIFLVFFVAIGIVYTLAFSWTTWKVALLLVAVWFPPLVLKTISVYRQYRWMALAFVLVVAQGGHLLEHTFQMIQIHVIGISVSSANGAIAVFNTEWVHFAWNGGVLIVSAILLYLFPRNPWLKVMVVFSTWHMIEHSYIFYQSLQTGLQGGPGLLAQGGAIGGGLPIIRPDLHFFYNLIEEILLVIAYLYQLHQLQRTSNVQINGVEAA